MLQPAAVRAGEDAAAGSIDAGDRGGPPTRSQGHGARHTTHLREPRHPGPVAGRQRAGSTAHGTSHTSLKLSTPSRGRPEKRG